MAQVYVESQAIERATVDRMKRRHGNINNEILMEKRVITHFMLHSYDCE